MDADLCLGDNLILFRCFAKHQTFKVNFQLLQGQYTAIYVYCYVMLCYVMLLLQYTAILIHHDIQYTYDNILQLEAGKPNNGYIYHILKGTRHQYHYAIRLCKKSKQMIQKQKLAENISQHVDFWKELKKINPITKCTTGPS